MPRGCWTHSVRRMCQGVPLRTCTRKFQGAVKFQIMIHGRIPPDLLKSLLELEASCSPAKQRQNISWPWPNCWLAVGFQKWQSVESLCKKIFAPVHAPCQILIHWQISMSENATPQLSGWNIKTAKLQSALAICCGRQRTAKCFVKSTRVRKPPNENAFGMRVAAALSSIQILPSAPACWWMTSTGVRPSSWPTVNTQKCIRSLFPSLLMIQWSKESQTSRYNLAQRWSEVTAFNSSITLVLCEVIRKKNLEETWKCHWNTCSTYKSSNGGFKMKLTRWSLFKGRNYLYLKIAFWPKLSWSLLWTISNCVVTNIIPDNIPMSDLLYWHGVFSQHADQHSVSHDFFR